MPLHPPSSPVSLPSIHELYPDHLLQHDHPPQHHLPPASLHDPHHLVRDPIEAGDRRPPVPSEHRLDGPLIPRPPHQIAHHFEAGPLETPYTYPPPSYASHVPRAARPYVPTLRPSYSFDVLRPDPSRSSLECVATSTTMGRNLPHRPHAHSSAPAFRVPSPQAESDPVHAHMPVSRDVRDARRHHPHGHYCAPEEASNVLANSSTAGRRSPSLGATSDHSASADKAADGGKRHTCPHCSKRFNRPSSLGIHVNTHTGAKPFVCPHPGCGRAFNVNSNMRRHHRNHSSSVSSSISATTSPTSMASPLPSASALHIIRYPSPDSHPYSNDPDRYRDPGWDGRKRALSWESYMPGQHSSGHGRPGYPYPYQ